MVVDALTDVVDRVEGRLPEIVDAAEVRRMEPCVVPSALEERHLIGRMRAFLQSPEASVLDDVGRIEPPGLEVLGGRRVQPLDRGHVDRLVPAPQRTRHA
jgi:hypothetical protein